MEISDPKINAYTEEHTSDPGDILKKIERTTYLRSIYPRMISGKVQGRFLSMISRMIQPERILEIGTFTGYSAICLCEGLRKDGQLHTIEINRELEAPNKISFEEAGVSGRVIAHFGNALDIIPQLGIQFELVFIDADKVNYVRYYQLAKSVLKPGGFILADNVLWSGKVLREVGGKMDKDTRAVKEFNEMVQADPETENVMIPVRDGMTLIQKTC